MKKNHLIAFVFLLFFNINIANADDPYYFERDFFGTSHDDHEDWGIFVNSVCSNDYAGCRGFCESYGSTNEIQLYYGSDGRATCNWKEVTKFKINDGSYSVSKNYLQQSGCRDKYSCAYYFYERNCKSEPTKNDFCSKLDDEVKNGNKGIVTEIDGGGFSVACDYVLENYYDFLHRISIPFTPIGITLGESRINLKVMYRIEFTQDTTDSNYFIIGLNQTDNKGLGFDLIRFENNEGYMSSSIASKLNFYGKDKTYSDFKNEFLNLYDKTENRCPQLYYGKTFESINSKEEWYTEFSPDVFITDERYKYIITENIHGGSGIDNGNYISDYEYPEINYSNILTIENCIKLFSDSPKLLNMIKTIVNATKIGIPILLVGLGTLDFSKAIFEGSEENMKKAQGKFIKRLMIGVCIFLIPTLLKLFLGIANSVWGNISADFCGIL